MIKVTEREIARPELSDEDGQKVGALEGDDTKARYVICAARPNVYQIEVPIDDAVVGKAVDGYHAYLDRLGEKLFKRAAQATRDARRSECIVREMLKDYDLPPLANERAME